MKMLLFNVYKVCFIHFNKEWFEKYPDRTPPSMNKLAASAGVTIFLYSICLNVWLPFNIVLSEGWENINKSMIWISATIAVFATDFFLFKALGLANLNYSVPDSKPDQRTIRRTWNIFIISGIISMLLAITKILVRGHSH
jgi:hypothetical protein